MALAVPPTLSVVANTWSLNDFSKLLSKGLKIALQKPSLILPLWEGERQLLMKQQTRSTIITAMMKYTREKYVKNLYKIYYTYLYLYISYLF